MDPNQPPAAPQAPAPQPGPAPLPQSTLPNNGFPASHNPYDFITSPNAPGKKKFALGGGGNSMKSRLFVVVGGLLLLIIVISIGSALLSSAGKANVQTLKTLAAEQEEILRITDMGVKQARETSVLNLAVTAGQSVTTDQQQLLDYLSTKKVKISKLELAAKKDKDTDSKLDTAAQNNNFDTEFKTTLLSMLNEYLRDTEKAYDNASNETSKGILQQSYNSTEILTKFYGETAAAN